MHKNFYEDREASLRALDSCNIDMSKGDLQNGGCFAIRLGVVIDSRITFRQSSRSRRIKMLRNLVLHNSPPQTGQLHLSSLERPVPFERPPTISETPTTFLFFQKVYEIRP
ncbi:hypothetical protein CC78DRAFT_613769 [Lojkania enalia]|uniref:Uncharacterized protein n=1 Tax=Lojkania enalia TaxID=147567 RepID=A0A9P4KFA7_9PLEO|nr:hypothetical protein CC78DRAFT_613769 [Didymosphaeria enalia]